MPKLSSDNYFKYETESVSTRYVGEDSQRGYLPASGKHAFKSSTVLL